MINAIIFDMGGVLLRTVDPKPRELMAHRFGCSRSELENFVFSSPTSIQSEVGMLSDIDHWRVVLEHFRRNELSPESAYYEFFSGDAINQNLMDFAKLLKLKFKVGLLSNAWENARKRLGALYDFIDLFDASIFSAEVGERKPNPKIFEIMLEKLGAKPEESIFIDDFPVNVEGAENAGLISILYENDTQVIKRVNQLLERK